MAANPTVYALLDAARQALGQPDGVAAQRLIAIVLGQHPEHLEARHLAGLASYVCILGERAMPGFAELLPLGVHSGDQHMRIGLVLEQSGQHALAREAFRTAALLDHHLVPQLRAGFGGPFNGQVLRMAAFRAIAETGRLAEVIETGAHRGTTTEFIARHVACPVKSTETNPYFYEIARLRFEDLVQMGCAWARQVELSALDSRAFLVEALKPAERDGACSFFYLDAHGDYVEQRAVEDPLVEEVRLIRAARRHCIVMIDDFNVADDTAYFVPEGHTIEQMAPVLPGFDAWFFPLASRHDTGHLRGCLVLSGSPETTALLGGVAELRLAGRG
jgi:hypothetical protein